MEFVLLTMIVLIVVVAVVASRLADNSYPFPFNKKDVLFTKAEKSFLVLLEKALGDNYRVINRVRLSDLLTIRNGVSQKTSQKANTLANAKYLDFVICHRESMTPCGVIDLVNTTGKGYKVKKDWFVSGALEASSIPHIRVKVKPGYSVDEIRNCVQKHLLGGETLQPKLSGKRIPAQMVKPRPSKKPAPDPIPRAELALAHKKQVQGQLAHLQH